MEAIEILKREHGLVERVARQVQRDLAADGDRLGARDLERFLDFFTCYADRCHDPKEEGLLFAALHRRGLRWEEPPLRDLVREHEDLRAMLTSARDWLQEERRGRPSARGLLLYDLGLFVDLLERHIAFEEDVLFPLATRLLSPADLAALDDAFRAIASAELETGAYAFFTDLAHDLAREFALPAAVR